MTAGEASRVRLQLSRPGFELDIDVALPATGITVLFGASGSGKTTVLRCVAGLERARSGLVRVGTEVWQDDATGLFLPAWKRPQGYVFQEASLFEHLDVRANIEYGLKRAGSRDAMHALDSAIDLLGIRHLLGRMPQQLSGGERQRVAIARALATPPRVLLLDEPLAALDAARKQEILPWLERMRDELRMPMLYVTHSAEELSRLADHLVVLDNGRVQAEGPPAGLLSSIDTPVLTGDDAGALLAGKVAERDTRWHLSRVDFDGGSLWLRDSGLPVGQPVRLRVLARDVSIATDEPHDTSIQNHLPCTIESSAPDAHPSQVLVRVRVGPSVLLARITARAFDALSLQPGSRAWLQVKSVALLR
jgi:molybdate transport system ATP-binding protein